MILREQVIQPVLAEAGQTQLADSPGTLSRPDEHYVALRAELQRTFQTLGSAA